MKNKKDIMQYRVILKSGKVLDVEVIKHQQTESHYGNGVYTTVNVNGKMHGYYDCRYEPQCSTQAGWEKFFDAWIRETWENNGKSFERIEG